MGIAFFLISIPTYLICLVVGSFGFVSAVRKKNISSEIERMGGLHGFIISTVLSFLLIWIGTLIYAPTSYDDLMAFFCVVGITPNVVPIIIGIFSLNRINAFSAGAFISVWFGFPYSLIWLDG